jgi:hypothetical protein
MYSLCLLSSQQSNQNRKNIEGGKATPAFLFNGSLSTIEKLGFERSRLIGKYKWVVTKTIPLRQLA